MFFPNLMHKTLEYDLNLQCQEVSRAVFYLLRHTVVLSLHILSQV